MATGAIGSLVPKLFDLLKQEYGLQKGVREKIGRLSRDLEAAQTALTKVGDVPWDELDPQVRLWARDVREASYDMEDIVDTFLVRVDAPKQTEVHMLRRLRKNMVSLFKKSKARRKISKLIQDIEDKLNEIEARRGRYTVDSITATSSAPKKDNIDPRLMNLYKRVKEFVGIKGPRNDLINKLSLAGGDGASDKSIKMVSVVGCGGLGKTTLARAVYDELKVDFECSAFVPVGRNPDVKKVFRDILIDLGGDKYMDLNIMILDEKQLMDKLKEFVKKKRCLIVIDDIWDKKSLELIIYALQESDCGSKLIITTRICEVAECASEVHKIQPLSHENSEKLLYARIQDGNGLQKYFDSPSAQACNNILKKCGGVPLAIITIASLLASKPSGYWSEVYSSIGFGHGDNEDVNNTRKILSFSYYDLPSHLKPCLSYLTIFPEDSIIEKNSLIWKWVAEIFIIISKDQEAEGVGLFELGERYFYDLINRSMIQPQESNSDHQGYVDACSVHDMVLDLIHSISINENFVTILDGDERQILPGTIARRLALQKVDVHISGGQVANNNITVEKARSLIADGCTFHAPSWSHLPVLRVLDLTNSDVEEDSDEGLLDGLGSLLRLRYLRVKDDSELCITELSKDVRYLKFLQTLDLLESYGIMELPEEVGLLTQLVCLRLSCDLRIVPAGLIGKLTSLQELMISWGDPATTMQFVKELGSLRELRVLYCRIDDDDKTESVRRALLESLGNMLNIRELYIHNGQLVSRTTSNAGFICCRYLRFLSLDWLPFSALPPWIKPSLAPNLSYLEVNLLVVKEQDMETLARLPELRSLLLSSAGNTKLVIVNIKFHTEGVAYFPKLRTLRIKGTIILFLLHRSECNNNRIASTVMPSLESLVIHVHVRCLTELGFSKDVPFDKLIRFDNLGRTSLQRVCANVYCGGARPEQVGEVQATLRHAAAVHPKHPTLRTILHDKDCMVSPYQEACMDGRRNPELLVNKGWKKLADIISSGHTRALCLPDASSSSKVMRLLYIKGGDRLLALSSNAVHKLWKWREYGDEDSPRGKASTSVPPQLWQRKDGIVMINDTANGNPEAAAACMAVVRVYFKRDYLFSASGGTLSVFDLGEYYAMAKNDTFMQPLPTATFVAFYPEDNIVAIGMDDSSIEIHDVDSGEVEVVLWSHQKKITGLTFSQLENVLVSSDSDAQLCVWSMEDWEKIKSTSVQPPCNCAEALVGDTTVQFHYDETHILVVHETQLAIYGSELECLCSWSPRDALPAPISSAVYSSDGLLVYAGFCDGAIGIFEADCLTLQCRIAPSTYIPSSVSSGGGNVYPTAVAANPWKPNQMAVGLSDGSVYVLEPPLDSDVPEGNGVSSGQRQPCGSSSGSGAGQQDI